MPIPLGNSLLLSQLRLLSSSAFHESFCSSVFSTSPSHTHLWQWHWKLQRVTHGTLLRKQLYLQRFIAISCWSGSSLWLLPHHQHCLLAEIPPGHSTAALSPADPAAVLPQDDFLQVLQKVRDAGDMGWAWVVARPCCQCGNHQGTGTVLQHP